ncbi:10156_t:CDS:2 [Paraglomus occultum]|uniref:10156_t:CDS:1 n=1 Tax=Paraglomus occultum TaxID=144539 RepID=A0A9N8ZXJ6_9GLOM|nr:10156_t:CDS:2 [Paraglomus occultum]
MHKFAYSLFISLLVFSLVYSANAAVNRKISVTKFPHTVVINSQSTDPAASVFGLYKFRFSTVYVPHIRVAAYKDVNDTTYRSTFRAALVALIEYNDTIAVQDSDSAFTYFGKGPLWDEIKFNDGDNGLKTLNTTLTAPGGANPFTTTISLYATETETSINGATLLPSDIKYSLAFSNFPYKYQNSKIAIVHIVFTTAGSKSSLNSDNAQITVSSNTTGVGRLEWAKTITADGKDMTISAETNVVWKAFQQFTNGNSTDDDAIASEQLETVVFKFDAVQPTSVVWDPRVGFVEDSTTSTNVASTVVNYNAFVTIIISSIFGCYLFI